jgi:hypothetical protein
MNEEIACQEAGEAGAWIREHALEDGLWDMAYARLEPLARARLKLCIARLHALLGEQPPERRLSLSFAAGFSAVREWRPAPYALIFCPTDLGCPERLLAACLPPLLAGTPLVLPWFFVPDKGSPKTPLGPLLAALELAGLEQAVLASGEDALKGLALFRKSAGLGRLVLLGSRIQSEAFVVQAHRLGLPCLALSGDEENVPLLDAAHQGVWVWTDLAPEWFFRRALSLTAKGENKA